MTTDEKRITVAEWLGHSQRQITWVREQLARPEIDDETKRACLTLSRIPEITLDWLHECEKKLDNERNVLHEEEGFETQLGIYIIILESIVGQGCAEEDIYANTIKATKEQRLSALVATLGLPKDQTNL